MYLDQVTCRYRTQARTYLDPGDVQVQDTGHQEADAEHQQEQEGHTPRKEHLLSMRVAAGQGVPSPGPLPQPQEDAGPQATCTGCCPARMGPGDSLGPES